MSKGPHIAGEESSDQESLLLLVGGRIRAARQRAKLKQSDVANAIGTKQSYIVGLEAGQANITLKTLGRVAAALGVSPVSLFLEEEQATGASGNVAVQLGQMLSAAMQDTDRLADLLRRAHALVAGEGGEPRPTTQS